MSRSGEFPPRPTKERSSPVNEPQDIVGMMADHSQSLNTLPFIYSRVVAEFMIRLRGFIEPRRIVKQPGLVGQLLEWYAQSTGTDLRKLVC